MPNMYYYSCNINSIAWTSFDTIVAKCWVTSRNEAGNENFANVYVGHIRLSLQYLPVDISGKRYIIRSTYILPGMWKTGYSRLHHIDLGITSVPIRALIDGSPSVAIYARI